MGLPPPTHHFHADLSLAVVSIFFFFFWLWFDGWVGQWVASNGQIGSGWVRMGRSMSTMQHHPSHTLRSDRLGFFFFFFGGCGLSFMGFNGLILVGYGGGWADFHGL